MSVSTLILSAAATLLAVLYLRPVIRFLKDVLHMKRLTKNVPSPPSLPVLGHLLHLAGDHDDVHDKVYQWTLDYGPTFKLWLGPGILLFVIQDPDDMEYVLTNPSLTEKSSLYRFMDELAGKGLLSMSGKVHRRHRKAITPFLHLGILEDFVASFDEEGRKMVDTLHTLADSGEVFNPKPICGQCSNSSVCKSIFSITATDEQVNRGDFMKALEHGQDLIMIRVWKPWLANKWMWRLSNHYSRFNWHRTVSNNFIKTVVNMKIAEKEMQEIEKTTPKRRKGIVDYLLSSEEEDILEKDELYEECKHLTVVASGTTRDALNYCCVVMAILPDMQQKIQQEVDDIFGTDLNRPVLPSDLPHLQYTERFIKETMRYFTSIPVFGRACNEDVKLPSGYVAPKGCTIGFFMPTVHHNPKYFPDPMKFDPDRFLPQNSWGRHPFCYLPFSAGARNCIGSRYAMMFLKTVVANLARRVNFIPAPNTPKRLQDVKVKMEMSMSIRRDGDVRVERRFPAEVAR